MTGQFKVVIHMWRFLFRTRGSAAGRPVPLHWEDELDWKAYTIFLRLHVVDHLNQATKVLAAMDGA